MTDDSRDLHIRLSKELYTRLKVKCAYQGVSMQDYIVNLLVECKEEQAHPAKKTVLVVDDEEIVRDSLKEWLRDNYEVSIMQTGEEAIDAIKARDFDVVLLDMRLTGKSGLDVLREVREFKPYIKMIMVTAYPAIDLAVQAIREGAVDYIVKPIAPDQLERMLSQIINTTRRQSL